METVYNTLPLDTNSNRVWVGADITGSLGMKTTTELCRSKVKVPITIYIIIFNQVMQNEVFL